MKADSAFCWWEQDGTRKNDEKCTAGLCNACFLECKLRQVMATWVVLYLPRAACIRHGATGVDFQNTDHEPT